MDRNTLINEWRVRKGVTERKRNGQVCNQCDKLQVQVGCEEMRGEVGIGQEVNLYSHYSYTYPLQMTHCIHADGKSTSR